ncbi:hypothetical protein [Paenibacillus sp. GYB003]|uniref:hypothetical protein n=1 Tax=Paenibacillus sp. GYB003 TaxID=2994392 RepID=UPI002F961C76
MIWFFIGGAIVVALLVYAHHESSRAAYYRAKAREIQLRNEATTRSEQEPVSKSNLRTVKDEVEEVWKQDVLIEEDSSPTFIQRRRKGITQQVGQHEVESSAENVSQDATVEEHSLPPFIQRRQKSISQQFDERDAAMIIDYHELESGQDYEDFLHLASVDTSKNGSELRREADPAERAAALKAVELDHDALQYLKIIGVETESLEASCESKQYENEHTDLRRFETEKIISMEVQESTPQELNLVQVQLPIENPDEELRPREVPEVTMYIGGKPRSGVQFIAGQIVDKFDDELCRLDDGTGTKIISHHRLRHFELFDHVICQVQVTSSGWDCLHVWGKFKEELQNAS